MPSMRRLFSSANVALYRATSGRIGGRFRGADALILTTIGRKSGQARSTPLLYIKDGEALVIVASNGGADRAPLWLGNLQANPEAQVQVRGERRPVHARVATQDEKARLWPKVTAAYAAYDDYQKKTARQIPLVVLDPA